MKSNHMKDIVYLRELNHIAATAGMNFAGMREGGLSDEVKRLAGEVADAAMTFSRTLENGDPENVREKAKDEFIMLLGAAGNHAENHNVPELYGQVSLTVRAIEALNNELFESRGTA